MMMEAKTFKSRIWDYFDKCISSDGQKRAQCNICKNLYSYETTTGNLRSHLEKTHGKQFLKLTKIHSGKKERLSRAWLKKFSKHFTKIDNSDFKIARCNYCLGEYSSKHTPNLVKHLLKKHTDIYEKYFAKVNDCNEVTGETFFNSNDEESNDASKLIEKDSDFEPCDDTDTTFIKEDNEDGDIFTEVVYLDEDGANSSRQYSTRTKSRPVKRFKIRQNSESSNEEKTRKVKARKFSSDNRRTTRIDESNHRSRTSFAESDDEIDNFGKYIVSLLKKMPTNVSRNIQRNVINTILNTEFENGIQQNAVTSDASNGIPIQITPVETVPDNYIVVEKKDEGHVTIISNSSESQV